MNELLQNIQKLHTTPMGFERIKKNLSLEQNICDEKVLEFCKNRILDKSTQIERHGKNWYAQNENIIFTVNAYSWTIITAHIKK